MTNAQIASDWERLCEQQTDPDQTVGTRARMDVQASTLLLGEHLSGDRTPSGMTKVLDEVLARPAIQDGIRRLKTIGEGGMGTVLLAEQQALRREVALKILRGDRQDAASRQAFLAEVRATAALEHPAVVPVHDAGADFMLMKRVTGTSLGELLQRGTPVVELVEVVLRICECVAYAHEQGVLHRDIKPENVMVGAFGEVYLLDWGLALALPHGPEGVPQVATASKLCAGTLPYMSPEIARHDRAAIGPGVDVFGLGALLYEIVAGQPPIDGQDQQALMTAAAERRLAPVPSARSSAYPRLLAIAEAAMAEDPAARGTAEALAIRLRDWQAGVIRRAEARWRLAEAERELALGGEAIDPAEGLPLLEHCLGQATIAATLDPELAACGVVASEARRELARHALAAGDLVLAGDVLDTDGDPGLEDLREELRRLRLRRERIRRATRLARRSALAALILLASCAFGFGALVATDHWRRDHARTLEAEALARDLTASPEAGAGKRDQILAELEYALALHPDPQALHGLILAQLESDITWALTDRRPGFARDRIERARRYGWSSGRVEALLGDAQTPGSVRYLEYTTERRRVAERQRRRDRLATLAREAPGIASPDPWLYRHASELTRWSWDADDQETAAVTRDLLRSLLHHPQAMMRRLGLEVLILHHRGGATSGPLGRQLDGLPVLPALHDPDLAVRAAAVAAIIERGRAEDVFVVARALESMDRRSGAVLFDRVYRWARSALEQAMDEARQQDDDELRRLGLLRVYAVAQTHGWLDISTRAWREAMDHHAQEPDAEHGELILSWQDRDLDRLRAVAHRLIRDHGCTEAYTCLAERLCEAGRFQECRELLEPLAQHTFHGRLLPLLALACSRSGDRQAAERHVRRALASFNAGDHQQYFSLVWLTNALESLGWLEDAIRVAVANVELHPDHRWCLSRLARVYLDAGHAEQALSRATEVRERWPEDHQAWQVMAESLLILGQPDEAIEAAREAVRRHSDRGSLHTTLGAALLAAGRPEDALLAYEAGAEADLPSLASRYRALALATQLGRPGTILRLALRGRAQDPTDPFHHHLLIRTLLSQGALHLAVDALETAAEQLPQSMAVNDLLNLVVQSLPGTRLRPWRSIGARRLGTFCAQEAAALVLGIQLPPADRRADVQALLELAADHLDQPDDREAIGLLQAVVAGKPAGWRASAQALVLIRLDACLWRNQVAAAILAQTAQHPAWRLEGRLYLFSPIPTMSGIGERDRERLIALAQRVAAAAPDAAPDAPDVIEVLRAVPASEPTAGGSLEELLERLQAAEAGGT